MAQFDARAESEVRTALLEIWSANERMNQLILEHLDPRAWRAKPPGGKSRTIAAIFSHVHNIRRKWVRLSAPHLKLPAELDRSHLTQKQAKAAFAESANRCSEMLADALTAKPARVRKFHRDGWAPSWPAGPTMVAYMLAHEAHHRGQVLMLAHQLGFALPERAGSGIWRWEKIWKECGFASRPR
jgi:uncharacterized damage-inducible protein DinB